MTGGNFHAIHEIQSCFTCWCCRPVGISDDQLFWSKSIHSTSVENHFGPSSKVQIALLFLIFQNLAWFWALHSSNHNSLILTVGTKKVIPNLDLDFSSSDRSAGWRDRHQFVATTGHRNTRLVPLFWPLQTCLLIKSYLSSFSSGTFVYNSWQAFILNTTPAKAVLFCACPVEFDWDRHESGFRPRISDCRSRQPASKYMGMFSDERLTYFQSETQRVRQSRHLG